MTETEIRRIHFLDKLYDFTSHNPGRRARITDLLAEDELDPDDRDMWWALLRQLRSEDMIYLDDSLTLPGASFGIAPLGRAEVEARRARRHDRSLRRSATRDAIVRWLYDQPGYTAQSLKAMITEPACLYEGEPFEVAELDEALAYLVDTGLVTGAGLWGGGIARPRLTDRGIDCAEHFGGSVSGYATRHENVGGVHNVTFNAPVSGNVTWASDNITQSAVTTGMTGHDLAAVLRALGKDLPELGLKPEDSAALASDLQTVEAELVTDQPNTSKIRTCLKRAATILGRAVDSSLKIALTGYTKYIMGKLGIPAD